jgi:hypothetical protein
MSGMERPRGRAIYSGKRTRASPQPHPQGPLSPGGSVRWGFSFCRFVLASVGSKGPEKADGTRTNLRRASGTISLTGLL